MRALILTHGTRGDVQPYVALTKALLDAGHQPVLGAPASFAGLAEPYGLPFVPLDDGPNTLMDDPRVRKAMETNFRGVHGVRLGLEMQRRSKRSFGKVLADMADAAGDGADVVVHAPGIPAHHIAEKLGVPAVPAAMQPGWVPTSAFTSPLVPLRLPRALNRASYLPRKVAVRLLAAPADALRTDVLDLPARRRRHDILRGPDGAPVTVLQAFSRHVLPTTDLGFPPQVHTTGFWFLPANPDWRPPAELTSFLAAGDPPVYLGFGSMVGVDPRRMGQLVTDAVRMAGVRAVLVAGWGGIQADGGGDDHLVLDQAPHDWLFPRMAAVVHHGGAGTTAAAYASGRPQVVCPFLADQPFWARRANAVGVAPPPLRPRTMTAETLASALRRATKDRSMAARAAELGRRIRAEDGVTTAVHVLEATASRR